MESNKQTAVMCALVAQMAGLFLIPAVGYMMRLLGASKGICCFFSWIAAVAWGVGFCLYLSAWSPTATPGWNLFPEGPAAMPFLLGGWIGGFIGYEVAEVIRRRISSDPARSRRSIAIATGALIGGLLVIGVCIGTIKRAGRNALSKLDRVEFPTANFGVIVKERLKRQYGSTFAIAVGHQLSPESPIVPIIGIKEAIEDVAKRPVISEGGGLLGIILKGDFYRRCLFIRSTSGQWNEFKFDEEAINQWPLLREEFEKRGISGSRLSGQIQRFDLEQRLVTVNYIFQDNVPVRFRISEDGTSLEFLGIDWPGGVAP